MNAPLDAPVPRTSLGRVGIVSVVATLALFGGGVAWAVTTAIAGAVIASGQVVVSAKPQAVQHLDGGVIEALHVRDGDRVRAGDPMIRLDPTLLEANLAIYETRLGGRLALRARLRAERLGRDRLEPPAPSALVADGIEEESLAAQRAILRSRRALHRGRREQITEKIAQFRNQIGGTRTMLAAKVEQVALIDRELKGMRRLVRRKLARESQMLAIERSRADLKGQIGEHESELARIANSIRDAELQLIQAESTLQEEVSTLLEETETRISELTQQLLSTRKQLARVDILAPATGVVHEMQVATVGGVVPPGATVAQIIPTDSEHVFETRVDPTMIDQVHAGQKAKLVLSAFNQRTTPELMGTVSAVSPNVVVDQATGLAFYKAWIRIGAGERAKIAHLDMVPGMPVEAFLQTDERTVMSYLVQPILDQLRRAFREE